MRAATVLFLAIAGLSQAQAADGDQVVIERGTAKITLADLDGRLSRLAQHEKSAYAAKPENMANLLNRLLINRQLADEARDLHLDQDPDVRRDLELAVEEVLAIHRLNALVHPDNLPDFRQLARERYLADPERFGFPEHTTVQHILIANDNRSDSDALALAQEVHAKAVASGADFSVLVDQYSDDPSKTGNGGRIIVSRPGELVPEFEAAARNLAREGEISEPVHTVYGYHLIRLVERSPARTRSFEDVEAELVSTLRTDYFTRIRENHRADLQRLPDNGDEELLRSLPERYGAPRIQPMPANAD